MYSSKATYRLIWVSTKSVLSVQNSRWGTFAIQQPHSHVMQFFQCNFWSMGGLEGCPSVSGMSTECYLWNLNLHYVRIAPHASFYVPVQYLFLLYAHALLHRIENSHVYKCFCVNSNWLGQNGECWVPLLEDLENMSLESRAQSFQVVQGTANNLH